MDTLTNVIPLFIILQVVLFEETKCVNLINENDDIKFRIEKLIDKRQQQLEDTLRKEFDKKIETLMDEQYREKQKVKELEETLRQQQREILGLKQSKETTRQEIIVLKQNIKDLMLKCQYTYNDLPASEELSPSFHGIAPSEDIPVVQQRRHSEVKSASLAVEKSRETRLLLGTVQPDDTPVAFYAYMSKNEENVGPHHILIFDQVETNIGNGYNSHTGAFIAPHNGIYLFAYTTHAESNSYFSIEIVVNSVSRGATYITNPESPHVFTGSTGIAVLFLNQGDDCLMRTHSTHGSHGTIRSDILMRTAFSGVKI